MEKKRGFHLQSKSQLIGAAAGLLITGGVLKHEYNMLNKLSRSNLRNRQLMEDLNSALRVSQSLANKVVVPTRIRDIPLIEDIPTVEDIRNLPQIVAERNRSRSEFPSGLPFDKIMFNISKSGKPLIRASNIRRRAARRFPNVISEFGLKFK